MLGPRRFHMESTPLAAAAHVIASVLSSATSLRHLKQRRSLSKCLSLGFGPKVFT